MNIKQAKTQIKNAISVYFARDEYGNFAIPPQRQRPVFLMGPPGIGKTAIMEQIAGELGIGLVPYSMTHHTRQSALGLPFISRKNYGGTDYDVSEYTMSEIIASVYDMMEETGASSGILFLDEINCVSETLAPAMLQFLQYKTFGRHRVPDGWIVVTAGNPPEYNKSVREFDIVTWDRIKRVDVEPDFDVWKEYAWHCGIHPAVITYLEIKRGDFYSVAATVAGKEFVTARGWMDLSDIMKLYEKKGIAADEALIAQYLQKPGIAKSFAVYYDLFQKYRSDYQVDSILAGRAGEEIRERAREARFDERIALLGLLLDAVTENMRGVFESEAVCAKLLERLLSLKAEMVRPGTPFEGLLTSAAESLRSEIRGGQKSSGISEADRRALSRTADEFDAMLRELGHADSGKPAFDVCKKRYDDLRKNTKKQSDAAKRKLDNLFAFCEKAFADSAELTVLVNELTINSVSARFISKYGSETYFRLNKDLLIHERSREIMMEIEELGL